MRGNRSSYSKLEIGRAAFQRVNSAKQVCATDYRGAVCPEVEGNETGTGQQGQRFEAQPLHQGIEALAQSLASYAEKAVTPKGQP
jgi:hypothetical protein